MNELAKIGAVAFAAADNSPESWWGKLDLNRSAKGLPYANTDNVARVLRGHPRYCGHVWWDGFHNRIRTDMGDSRERAWRDADDVEILTWLQGTLKIPRVALSQVQQAVVMVAMSDQRREPSIWLQSLVWDKYRRLDGLATLGFGAEDNDYSLAVGSNLLKSLVARMLIAGSKVDTMVVLESAQGAGKTQALQILGGPWYGELHSAFGTKDAVQELASKALLEIAELEAMTKREVEAIKAWLSRRVDTYRPSYGRHAIDVERSCIFVGTTNEWYYLRDASGARRFWPLRCGRINLDWLRDNREQLFAEAMERVGRQLETWWQVPIDEATREQDARYEGDPWTEPIDRWLASRDTTTISAVLVDALAIEVGRQGKREQMRAAAVMRRLGWVRKQDGTERQRTWRRVDAAGGSGGSRVVRIPTRANIASEPPEPLEQPN